MYYILAGVGGVIIGYLIATVVARQSGEVSPEGRKGGRKRNAGFESRGNSRQLKENLEKLRIFAQSKNEFTNQDVEKELGVSDATLTRYCEQLEKEGLVTQVGETGKYVKYISK